MLSIVEGLLYYYSIHTCFLEHFECLNCVLFLLLYLVTLDYLVHLGHLDYLVDLLVQHYLDLLYLLFKPLQLKYLVGYWISFHWLLNSSLGNKFNDPSKPSARHRGLGPQDLGATTWPGSARARAAPTIVEFVNQR